MNYFDLIFVIPILWGAYKGFSKGLIVSVASLFALILGIYGAIRFSVYVGSFVARNVDVNESYVPLIAFATTFIGIVIGIHFLAKVLNKLVKAIALGWLNTIAGIVFGLVKVAFILSVFIFIVEKIDSHSNFISKQQKEESLLYAPVKIIAPTIFPALKDFEIDPQLPKNLPQFSV